MLSHVLMRIDGIAPKVVVTFNSIDLQVIYADSNDPSIFLSGLVV